MTSTSASAPQPAAVPSSESAARSRLWQVEIHPVDGFPDRLGADAISTVADLGILASPPPIRGCRGFLVELPDTGPTAFAQVTRIARELLAEPIVHRPVVVPAGAADCDNQRAGERILYIWPKPGVTDPEAESAVRAIGELGVSNARVRTFRKYYLHTSDPQQITLIASRILCNESIEQWGLDRLPITSLQMGASYQLESRTISLREASSDQLRQISRDGQLSLTEIEMQTIQAHYRQLQRDPTEIELETIAQTWSEHCSHKTLAGRVHYEDEQGTREFQNMLKETIFAATQNLRRQWGEQDWCVSVFRDNAGIVKFTDDFNVTFKVETHNRPSAIEPYGGANTGLGGVIRDTLGTGLGAKPICSTDVFCFADPHRDSATLPPGVLHPRRVMNGVVAGVRDYGNRMGIPTVNGAVYFDDRYIGNPLVFCGNVGLIPHAHSFKEPQPGDLIVAVGGRTGRDGIHGATFSSAELTDKSETVSSGAVQIGHAIAEKMVLDVLLAARDRGLYNAVTDCGAGGFSSAVGEMGEKIGAVVWLERAPLKYAGLSPTEIWISEAQERMVLAVPPQHWPELEALCQSESVEATVIGEFEPTGQLRLTFQGTTVGELAMEFLHEGRPPVQRRAVYRVPTPRAVPDRPWLTSDYAETLKKILEAPNVASKHWIIRQYDHEVLAGSVVKPLVGAHNDGPSDAAVVRPLLRHNRGIVIACGMNPLLGDLDAGVMAASSIDEAVRNCVAVGADPSRIGILDNFCWGYTDRPETLGSLVKAAMVCQTTAEALGTPFISGKDSLNNEFSYTAADGQRRTISIPATLLISALGQIPDVHHAVTMDLKGPGNALYLIGDTTRDLGGSHALWVHGEHGSGTVPAYDAPWAARIFAQVFSSIQAGWVRSCHDLSEGGLAVAAAEMAFAGDVGVELQVAELSNPAQDQKRGPLTAFEKLFAENSTRFLVEVPPEHQRAFETAWSGLPCRQIGRTVSSGEFVIRDGSKTLVAETLATLKRHWQSPFDWR